MREPLTYFRALNAVSGFGRTALKPFKRGLPGVFQGCFDLVHQSTRDVIRAADLGDRPIALFQWIVPVELGWALGVYPLAVETLPYLASLLAEPLAHEYLDNFERSGVPSHACSAGRLPGGFAVSGQFPRPDFIVTTAMPCDNLSTYYTEVERLFPDAPIYRVDSPYLFDDPAEDYYVEEMFRMIEWMEGVTGKKLSESRLRAVVEESNRAWEYILGLWDIMKSPPAVIPAQWLWFVAPAMAEMGHPRATAHARRVYREARRMLSEGRAVVPDERYRYVQWGVPAFYSFPLFEWLEETYGAVMVSTMIIMIGSGPVDTRSMESMIRGLCRNSRNYIMNTQAFGPSERYTEKLARDIKEYNANLVIHFDTQGCKNTHGIKTFFRDVARDLGAPIATIDIDAFDSRVVPVEGIKAQIANFMDTLSE